MRWIVLIGLMFALIIIPFILFEKQFEALGTWLAEGHASGGLAASIIVALLALDVFLPVPSSIVSTGAGVLLGFWRGVAVIWIGMTIGCVIGYAFGAKAAGAEMPTATRVAIAWRRFIIPSSSAGARRRTDRSTAEMSWCRARTDRARARPNG